MRVLTSYKYAIDNNNELYLMNATIAYKLKDYKSLTFVPSDIVQCECRNNLNYGCVVTKDGSLYSYGVDSEQINLLGLGVGVDSKTAFTKVTSISNVKQVQCEEYCTYVLKHDGTVWYIGRLSSEYNEAVTTWTKISGASNFATICSSNGTSIWGLYGITKTGSLYCVGFTYGYINANGDTGGSCTSWSFIANDVKQVSPAVNSVMYLKKNGDVYACGNNFYGQLGINSTSTAEYSWTKVTSISEVKKLGASYNAHYAIKNDNTLWGVGYNQRGGLGLSPTDSITQKLVFTKLKSNVKDVLGAYERFYYVTTDNIMYYPEGSPTVTHTKCCYNGTTTPIKPLIMESSIWGTPKFIIQSPDGFYTMNESNGSLVKLSEAITLEVIQEKGATVDTLSTYVQNLPTKFLLMGDNNFKVTATGIKKNDYLLVSKDKVDLPNMRKVKKLAATMTSSGAGTIKMVLSADEGATWSTLKVVDGKLQPVKLPITIPHKNYEDMIDSEKAEWDNAKETIYSEGVDVSTLSTTDVKGLPIDRENLMFAYVIHLEKATDNVNISTVALTYEQSTPYTLMKETEYDLVLDVSSHKIAITPKADYDSIKINVLK